MSAHLLILPKFKSLASVNSGSFCKRDVNNDLHHPELIGESFRLEGDPANSFGMTGESLG